MSMLQYPGTFYLTRYTSTICNSKAASSSITNLNVYINLISREFIYRIMTFHLLGCGVIYDVIKHNVLFNHNRLLKVQLEINHQIIAHIEFEDEDDKSVENKTK